MTVCFVLNRVHNAKNRMSPYELWKGWNPNISYFRIWRCLAYVRIPYPKRIILASGVYRCVFIGYSSTTTGYMFYDLENKVILLPMLIFIKINFLLILVTVGVIFQEGKVI